jgi:hypothetical protein
VVYHQDLHIIVIKNFTKMETDFQRPLEGQGTTLEKGNLPQKGAWCIQHPLKEDAWHVPL